MPGKIRHAQPEPGALPDVYGDAAFIAAQVRQ
jgi:hypothetical protein